VNKTLNFIVKKVKKLFGKGKRGVKKRSPKEQKKKAEDDKKSKSRKEIEKKVRKGLADVSAEEGKVDKDKDRELTMEEAKAVAARIKRKHKVFKVFKVVDGGTSWDYTYVANPRGKRKGKKKEKARERIKLYTVNFNSAKDTWDSDKQKDYISQLKGQEAGINRLKVENWIKNRKRYSKEGRSKEGSKAQKEFREKKLNEIIDNLVASGKTYAQAEKEAKKQLKGTAALHDPDQIAGGEATAITRLGYSGVNSSIGSQWDCLTKEPGTDLSQWLKLPLSVARVPCIQAEHS